MVTCNSRYLNAVREEGKICNKTKKKNGGRIRLPSDLRKLAQGGWGDLTKTRVSFAMGLAFSC